MNPGGPNLNTCKEVSLRHQSNFILAMEAIFHAGTVLGVLAKDGVVLAAEKKITGKLLALSYAKEWVWQEWREDIQVCTLCSMDTGIID